MTINVCQNPSRAFNEIGQVIQVACDSWYCPDCRKILAYRWAERIRYGLALRPYTDAWFWTITLPGWVPSPDVGYRLLPERWDNFRKTLQRKNGDFLYAAFIEGQPERDGMPHFHIITLAPAPSRLKDLAVHAGFGFEADEREISSGEAVGYVVKYANKSLPHIPRHFRRVRISQIWPSLPQPFYPLRVYPMQRGEALSPYLARVAATIRYPLDVLRDAWLDRSADIR